MTDYRVRAQKFLKTLMPYIDRGLWTKQLDVVAAGISDFNRDRNRNVVFLWGSSRGAILSSDYCIKFDYAGEETTNFIGDCYTETKFYSFAKQEGFGYLFAEATLIIVNGIAFEIMPRIKNIGKYDDEIYRFLNRDEFDFVTSHITDMHNANYGWHKGHPVIIDYAFNEFCECW